MQLGLIRNAKLLEDVLGTWPSFHDAEVESLLLSRGGADGPTLDIAVQLLNGGASAADEGRDAAWRRTLVKLRFEGVALERVHGFNQQNVLWDLTVAAVDPMKTEGANLHVVLASSFGLEASFWCVAAEVLAVIPE